MYLLRRPITTALGGGKCRRFLSAKSIARIPEIENLRVPTVGLINGQWLPSNGGDTFPVLNPANGNVISEVANMGRAETLSAIDASYAAQPSWHRQPLQNRINVLKKWHRLTLDNRQDLAKLITLEAGKPFRESLMEVDYAASFVEFYAEQAKAVRGEVITDPRTIQRQLLVVREPVGVAGLVTPWNFPLAMIYRKAATALVVGCSVVMKPGEDTPLTALAAGQLLTEHTDIPAGVFNIVTSSRGRAPEIGEALAKSTKVGALSLTGSTATGKVLMAQAAETIKKLSFELGGNAPFIVFESADIDKAVSGCLASRFRNAGQTCVCANRIFVHEVVHDQFVEKLTAKVAALHIGNGLDYGIEIGPLINERAVEKVARLVDSSVSQGATVRTGGKRWKDSKTFYEPTVLTDVTPDMPAAAEEIFGPVASVIKFSSEKEVVSLANDTQMGLVAYFFTEDPRQMWRVSQQLHYGAVGVNESLCNMDVAPSTGRKQSGLGSESSHHGFDEYLEYKLIVMGDSHGL